MDLKEFKQYVPELGQAAFGQPCKEFSVTYEVEQALRVIRGVMESKSKDLQTPFDNSGMRFKNDVFEVNAYDWSECDCGYGWDDNIKECTCGHEPQAYNFKWKDFEVSWYKHYRRGNSMNREIDKPEVSAMLSECVKSLLNE